MIADLGSGMNYLIGGIRQAATEAQCS